MPNHHHEDWAFIPAAPGSAAIIVTFHGKPELCGVQDKAVVGWRINREFPDTAHPVFAGGLEGEHGIGIITSTGGVESMGDDARVYPDRYAFVLAMAAARKAQLAEPVIGLGAGNLFGSKATVQ